MAVLFERHVQVSSDIPAESLTAGQHDLSRFEVQEQDVSLRHPVFPNPLHEQILSTYPALLEELLRRGYSEADIAAIDAEAARTGRPVAVTDGRITITAGGPRS